MLHLYRNQSIDLQCKSIDWFLYECNIGLISTKPLKEVFIIFLKVVQRYLEKVSPKHFGCFELRINEFRVRVNSHFFMFTFCDSSKHETKMI